MRIGWWLVGLASLLLYTVSPLILLLLSLIFYSYQDLLDQDSLSVALPWLLIFTVPTGLLASVALVILFFSKWFAPRN